MSERKSRPLPRETLARNLRYLKDKFGLSDKDMEKRSGVAAKTINNYYNGRTNVQLDQLDEVAKIFGLNYWHLIMPGLPEDYDNIAEFDQLVENWTTCNIEGRKHILMVSDRESLFTKKSQPA